MSLTKENKIKGALLGFVVGDCYNIPFHWYYDTKQLLQAFPDIDNMGLIDCPMNHLAGGVSSFEYKGSIEILYDRKKYYGGGDFGVDNVHYHGSLKKGQNTHNICISRLLMRTMKEKYDAAVKASGKESIKGDFFEVYHPLGYIESFYNYTTTNPKDNEDDAAQIFASNDLYFDRYIRRYFENASTGLPKHLCAHDQRAQWSISAIDGLNMYLPMVLAYINEPQPYLVARAIELQNLTHKSLSTSAAFGVIVPLLQNLINGSPKNGESEDAWFQRLLVDAMKTTRPSKISPAEMFGSYGKKGGPDAIPLDEKWQQHLELSNDRLDVVIDRIIAENLEDTQVAGSRGKYLATACYSELSVALTFYILRKYGNQGYKECLLRNAKVGGHTTGRGVLLGTILGARYGAGEGFGAKAVPEDLINELAATDQVIKEVNGVVEIAMNRV